VTETISKVPVCLGSGQPTWPNGLGVSTSAPCRRSPLAGLFEVFVDKNVGLDANVPLIHTDRIQAADTNKIAVVAVVQSSA